MENHHGLIWFSLHGSFRSPCLGRIINRASTLVGNHCHFGVFLHILVSFYLPCLNHFGKIRFKKVVPISLSYGYGSIPIDTFLGGWTSIYQLFWCSPGVQGFDTLPYVPTKNWKWMPATDPDLFGCVVWDSPWWKGLEWQNSRKLSTMKNDEKHSAGCIPWSHWTRFNQQSQDGKSHTLQAATVQHCGLCTFKLWTVNRKRDFPGGYCNYSSGQATKKNPTSLTVPVLQQTVAKLGRMRCVCYASTWWDTCQNMSNTIKYLETCLEKLENALSRGSSRWARSTPSARYRTPLAVL